MQAEFAIAGALLPQDLAQWWLWLGILAVAFLYSSVGHAGASGYIAVLTLFSLPLPQVRTAALCLNVAVATLAFVNFYRAGHFSWQLFWPFAVVSIPMAWVGGVVRIPAGVLQILLGLVLLASAVWLLVRPGKDNEVVEVPPVWQGMLAGGGLGLLAGLTGTGGGIFLTPLILWMKWAPIRIAAGVSALFILVNSASGLAGNLSRIEVFPHWIWSLGVAALAGGLAGSYLGSRILPAAIVKRILALVLALASVKLLMRI